MQGCLDEKQLLDLAYGTASAELRRAADEHARTCDRCRELLDSTAERITWTGDEPRTSEPTSEPLVAQENLPALPVKAPKPTAKKPIATAGKLDPKALVDALRTAGFPVRPTRGTTIGRYIVIDRLAEGARGMVLSAYDVEGDRKVVLRLLPNVVKKGASPEKVALDKAAAVQQSFVVPIWDVGIEHERIYVATEFVKGRTLSEWLGARPRSSLEVIAVFVQAGRGLEAAHAAGVVHGDFRPSEVFVGHDGRARVADIGIAGVIEKKRASAADDQYQFCLALSQVLGADAPERVRRAIKRGQSERVEDRFASMTELLAELDIEPRQRMARIAAAIGLVLLGMVLVLVLDRFGVLK